jgi:SAM-dependent methyltransferase
VLRKPGVAIDTYPLQMTEVECWSPLKVWAFSLLGRDPRSNRIAIDLLELGPGDRLLDIGCGLGAALERAVALGAEAEGIDPSPSMVARASGRVPAATVKLGSAEEIPFEDGRFTVVMAVATFHHWADRERGLYETFRVLEPGGRLLILEGHLKKGHGHGLSDDEAHSVGQKLGEIGFADFESGQVKDGRHRFATVTATKPSDPVTPSESTEQGDQPPDSQ